MWGSKLSAKNSATKILIGFWVGRVEKPFYHGGSGSSSITKTAKKTCNNEKKLNIDVQKFRVLPFSIL